MSQPEIQTLPLDALRRRLLADSQSDSKLGVPCGVTLIPRIQMDKFRKLLLNKLVEDKMRWKMVCTTSDRAWMCLHLSAACAAIMDHSESDLSLAQALTELQVEYYPGVRRKHSVFGQMHWPRVPLSTETRFRFVEIFAGIGGKTLFFSTQNTPESHRYFINCLYIYIYAGFRLGLEPLGGKCAFASEIDVHAQATYLANFHDPAELVGDITGLPLDSTTPPFELLTGGFPCQSFSQR